MHSHWRDLKEWKSYNLPMSTASDEACKLYDAGLTQIIGFHDDPVIGGLANTMDKMLEADPNFIMGHVMKTGMKTISLGNSLRIDNTFGKEIYTLADMADKQRLTQWEQLHIKAVKFFAEGQMSAAVASWEEILLDHPFDMLSLVFLHNAYLFLGDSKQMRDSPARVIPYWKPHMPHYSNILGIHAFGMQENHNYPQSEKLARKVLEMNPYDAWSVHAVAHCKEMTGKYNEGIEFMQNTEQKWSPCRISVHTYWHWSLFYIEKGDYESALGIFDNALLQRMNRYRTVFNVDDLCALLFRLEMEGIDVGDRWQDLFDVAQPHVEDNLWAFNDVSIYLTCLRQVDQTASKIMKESLRDFVRTGAGDTQRVAQELTLPLYEAIQAFDEGNFGNVVDLVHPIRHKIIQVGASNAQRDIFNILLIQSAIRSEQKRHHKLARSLIHERQALREDSPMCERMMDRLMALHD